jgi:hypothetical protein
MAQASRGDIHSILGNLDPDKLLAIVELRPSTGELEEASMWLSGDRDVFGTPVPLKGTASEIVTILTADEDEEERG